MRLKNKKTGETYEGWLADLALEKHYGSLAELNSEWEDVPEEPNKTYWYIGNDGTIYEDSNSYTYIDKLREQIGNRFETKEEAKKAMEKLKAFKRLKDKGFRFDGYDVAHKSNGNLAGQIFYDAGNYSIEDVEKEMDLIFGGEE